METKESNFWWLKSNTSPLTKEITNSLVEYLEHEKEAEQDSEVDIPSILEEISRLSAKSPLGPYLKDNEDRNIEDIMKEVEKVYIESSKSFEQLSHKSKTLSSVSSSLNSSSSASSIEIPTPKSESPVPLGTSSKKDSSEKCEEPKMDSGENNYSEDFESPNPSDSTGESKIERTPEKATEEDIEVDQFEIIDQIVLQRTTNSLTEELDKKTEIIKMLLLENKALKEAEKRTDLSNIKMQMSKEANYLEELKDAKELNTALQVQLEQSNKTIIELRTSLDESNASKLLLERRLAEMDNALYRYKTDLQSMQTISDKLKENEASINNLLEMERAQMRNYKQQTEKDSKCIMDLNRQIKEMERIIARKHPDSVSALIVASKNEDNSAVKVLEDRIKQLEQEAIMRDAQNTEVFKDVQDRYNKLKLKYESYIELLEKRSDTYDVYTQTKTYDDNIPKKDNATIGVQTDSFLKPKVKESKEETHLLATIRGYQNDLGTKEKLIVKLQKDIEELRKTNRRLQKEREGSLRNLTDKKYYAEEKPTDEQVMRISSERDKLKAQLCRIEEDYQALKAKRLQDLNTLQEAHEGEISIYLANITPLREQLEVQQVTITSLQKQLASTKLDLAIISEERDHLNKKINNSLNDVLNTHFENGNDQSEVEAMRKKVQLLEVKYEERENRLRAIVHGLAQKTISNKTCEQCSERQQQLIGYRAELDQILATLKCLQ